MFVHFIDLAPFTDYKLSVDCIPLVDGRVIGFWSEAVYEQLTTEEDGSSHYKQPSIII